MAARSSEDSLRTLIIYLKMNGTYDTVIHRLEDYQNITACIGDFTQLLEECAAFPVVYPSTKSGFKSISERIAGEEYASKNNYTAALQYYNKAIASAFPYSEELGMAYASRSKILFKKDKYNECITDIKRAYSLVSKNTKVKIELIERCRIAREKTCFERRNSDYEKIKEKLFSLPTIPNVKNQNDRITLSIPCANPYVKIVSLPTMGRGVIATKDIGIGGVIAIEKPYVPILARDHYLQRCYNCLEKCENMLPCHGCDYVMFCDESCREESYHNLECTIMSYLIKSQTPEADLIALRTILKARQQFPELDLMESKTYKSFLNRPPEEIAFVPRKSDKDLVYDSQHYEPIHNLQNNMQKKSGEQKLEGMVRACVLLHLLKHHIKIFDGWIDEYCDKSVWWNIIGEILYRNILSAVNKRDIETIVMTSSKKFICKDVFGVGVYPFTGLLNHSCVPNTRRIFDGTNIVLMAINKIKKGQQVFDCYWKPYTEIDRKTRQEYLKEHFHFDCACDACKGDWGVFQELPDPLISVYSRRIYNTINFQDTVEEIQCYNKRTFFRIMEKMYKNAQILNNYKPGQKLALHEKLTEHCWLLFGNVTQYNDYFIKILDIPNSTNQTMNLFHSFNRMIGG